MRLIILLAVIAAASRWTSAAVADDTLNIRSLRSIDVCGSEKSALIAIDLGEIYFSDSLMSFDITLSYDTTYLIPGSVLSNGTLSQQLSWMDGPILNAAEPGELRVFGASILTPAKGNLPLVAITADAKSMICGVTTPIELVYPADFNPEFKRSYSLWKGDSVRFIARQVDIATKGFSFEVQDVTIGGTDSTIDVPFVVTNRSRDNNDLTVQLALASTDGVLIDRAYIGNNAVTVAQGRDTVWITLSGTDTVHQGTLRLRQVTTDSLSIALTGSIMATACACTIPKKTDQRVVKTTLSTSTGIDEKDIDDDPEITLINGMINLQGGHEYPMELKVYDLYGRLVANTFMEKGTVTAQVQDLPPGPVFIMMTAGGRTKRMMQRN